MVTTATKPDQPTLVATPRLRNERWPKGQNQAVASLIGLSPQAVSNIRFGRKRIRPRHARVIADYLGREVEDLFVEPDIPITLAGNPERPMLERQTVSARELAMITGIGIQSVFDRTRDGRIRSTRIGKRILIPASEVRRLVEEGCA